MTKEKALKLQAKKHLKGNMPSAVGATLTLFLAVMTCIYLPVILYNLVINALIISNTPVPNVPFLSYGLLLMVFLACVAVFLPLIAGYIRFCYLMSKYNYCDYSEVFYYYSKGRFFTTIRLYLLLMLKSLWQAVISFLPGIIFLLSSDFFQEKITDFVSSDYLAFISVIWYYISYALLFAGLIFFLMLTKNNFLAVYFYIEKETLKASDICSLSAKAAVRFGKDINRLNFSFLPMMLLCILIIPAIFVLPYIFVTKATSAKWMIALSNKDEA